MSGQIVVTKTRDWLTPWEVAVLREGHDPSVARFAAPSKAQTYAVTTADETGLPLVYKLDVSEVPTNSGSPETSSRRTVSPEEFQRRMERRCSKCRHSKPLAEFRGLTRVNQTRGKTVPFGWAERCLDCEEATA